MTGLCPTCNLNYYGSILPVPGMEIMSLFQGVVYNHLATLFQNAL